MDRKRSSRRNSPAENGGGEGAPASSTDGGEGAGDSETPSEGDEPAGEDDKMSAFLPKEFFGDHECKVGDTYTITVKAIDPETGEKEVAFNAPKTEKYKAPGETPSVSGVDDLEGPEM